MIKKIYELLNTQDHHISFYPTANNKDWMMNCNGTLIGGIFDEKVCFLWTEKGSAFLGNPEPVSHGYSKNAKHKMLLCSVEQAKEMLFITDDVINGPQKFVCDISSLINVYSHYPSIMVDMYDAYVTLLQFCVEKGFFTKDTKVLDYNNRILKMNYVNNDFTEKGKKLFLELEDKWLGYNDKTDKNTEKRKNNRKMLEKYYQQLIEEYDITDD